MDHFRNITLAALAALMASLAAGCMPDTPRTQLNWNVNTRTGAPHRVAGNTAGGGNNGGARTYVYQDKNGPTPRPASNYVSKDEPPYTSDASAQTQDVAPVGAPSFAWPVSGRVISDFGNVANGGKNDGINIATAMGAPIHASASGTVTYAGDELKGYGNLVLVKHGGGYTTAYAHAERLTVARGDFVARGQVIGYSGQTGDVSSPQLHFEIRSNTTPVNPRAYLSTTSARS